MVPDRIASEQRLAHGGRVQLQGHARNVERRIGLPAVQPPHAPLALLGVLHGVRAIGEQRRPQPLLGTPAVKGHQLRRQHRDHAILQNRRDGRKVPHQHPFYHESRLECNNRVTVCA